MGQAGNGDGADSGIIEELGVTANGGEGLNIVRHDRVHVCVVAIRNARVRGDNNRVGAGNHRWGGVDYLYVRCAACCIV